MVDATENVTGPAWAGACKGWRQSIHGGITGALVMGALMVGTHGIAAEFVPVPNGSFESPTPVPPLPVVLQLDHWQEATQPDWFDPDGFGITWDQTTGAFANTLPGSPDHITNMDGDQAAYMFALPGVEFYQELENTYQVGLSYRLTAGLVSSSSQILNEGSLFQLSLYYRDGTDAVVDVASTTISYNSTDFPTLTEFVDFSVDLAEIQAGDAWAGENIGIRLVSLFGEGGIWDVDNVRLQAIPEPGTMGLVALGLGIMAMAWRGRARPAGRSR